MLFYVLQEMKRHLPSALAAITLASAASGGDIRHEVAVVGNPSDDYLSICGWEFDVDGGGYSTCAIDLDGDGFLDLRLLYEKGQIVRQEADTNGDRRVDVWVNFQNGERHEQLEDQTYRGKINARYAFQNGQVVTQEQVADADPPSIPPPFMAVEEELRSVAGDVASRSANAEVTTAKAGVEPKSDSK